MYSNFLNYIWMLLFTFIILYPPFYDHQIIRSIIYEWYLLKASSVSLNTRDNICHFSLRVISHLFLGRRKVVLWEIQMVPQWRPWVPWTFLVFINKHLTTYSIFYLFQNIKQCINSVAFHRHGGPASIIQNYPQV